MIMMNKVLCLNWNIAHDTFIFKLFLLSEFAKELKPTKRNILRVTAKLFDPMYGHFKPIYCINENFISGNLSRKVRVGYAFSTTLGAIVAKMAHRSRKGTSYYCSTLHLPWHF